MSHDEDPLQDNPFFKHLQRSSVFDQASKKNYIIAIPPSQSLEPNAQFARDFSLSHILIRSTQRPQVYHTLSSRTLVLRDQNSAHSNYQELITVSTRTTSWPEQRTVKMVSEETYYTESFESFPVIRISLPLIGPINQQYLRLIEAQTLCRLDCLQRGFNEHVHVILTTLGDDFLPLLTQQTQSFLQGLKSGYILLRDFEQNLNEKIDLFCSATLIGIITTLHNALPPLTQPTPAIATNTNVPKERSFRRRPKSSQTRTPPPPDDDESPPQSHHNNSHINVNNIMKQSDGFPLTMKNWAEIIIAIESFVMTKLSNFISRKMAELYHSENTLLYNAALWAQYQLSILPDPTASPPPTLDPNLTSARRNSSQLLSFTQPQSMTNQNANSNNRFTFAPLQSNPSASNPSPLLPTYLPTPSQHPIIPTPPQPFPLTQRLSSFSLPPDHPFFTLINLRAELAVVDFTDAANALQQALSNVRYDNPNPLISQHLPSISTSTPPTPMELFQSGLALQAQLFEVQTIAQKCVLNHYSQYSPSYEDPLEKSMSFAAFTDNTGLTGPNVQQSQSQLQPQQPQPQQPQSQRPIDQLNSPPSAQNSPPSREDLSITAEDQIALFQYLLILRPSYSGFSQLRYLSNFSPLDINGMGYASNTINLPTNPAPMVLPVAKIEMMTIALHGATSALLQLYQHACPQQHAHLSSQPDRPPAHFNASVVRVNTQPIRNYPSLPRAGLDIFSGHSDSTFAPISPRQTNIRHTPHPQGSSPPSHSTNPNPTAQSQQMHVQVHSDLNHGKKSPLNDIDMDLIRRMETEQSQIDAKAKLNANGGSKQNNNDDDDDFLSSLMKNEVNSGQL